MFHAYMDFQSTEAVVVAAADAGDIVPEMRVPVVADAVLKSFSNVRIVSKSNGRGRQEGNALCGTTPLRAMRLI